MPYQDHSCHWASYTAVNLVKRATGFHQRQTSPKAGVFNFIYKIGMSFSTTHLRISSRVMTNALPFLQIMNFMKLVLGYHDNSIIFSDSCTALTLDTCRNVGYNRTFLPNVMLHGSISDAVDGFHMLPETVLHSNCSELVTFYLCGLYFPECSEDGEPLYPCKSLCEGIEYRHVLYLFIYCFV